ncbi:MAG: iron-sulfur cluster assembly accessory protein [Cyanobacteria bacterium P01_F01_bin.150]
MIHLTSDAVKELKRLGKYRQEDLKQCRLRIGVQPGCCAGFSYSLSFDTAMDHDDIAIDSEEIAVVINRQDLNTLDGLTIDYSEDLMGGAFRFLNPNAFNTSDCGNSFSLPSADSSS